MKLHNNNKIKKTIHPHSKIKGLLFSTKKNPIKTSSTKTNHASLVKNSDNENNLINEKHSFEYNKLSPLKLFHLTSINFIYAEEIGLENWSYLFKALKKFFNQEQKKIFTVEVVERITLLSREIIHHKNNYDSQIAGKLIKWEIDRISYIKKAILRWGIYLLTTSKARLTTILPQEYDLPKKKVFSLAIDFAKWLADKKDYTFINAVLSHFHQGEK